MRALGLSFALLALAAGPGLGPAPAVADDARVVHVRIGSDEQALGQADAAVVVLEFTDYQCPYCRRFQTMTWPRLKREYIDSGRVRFIVRDLPLAIHPQARLAAEAARCAAEQGRFWRMHDELLASGTQLDLSALMQRAQSMGLDAPRFRDCVTANKYDSAIARSAASAASLGLQGTPAFVLGRMSHGVLEGIRVYGAVPYADFARIIDALLAMHEPAQR